MSPTNKTLVYNFGTSRVSNLYWGLHGGWGAGWENKQTDRPKEKMLLTLRTSRLVYWSSIISVIRSGYRSLNE